MLRFHFHGGYLDGQTLASGKGPDGVPMPGEHYVFLTDGGRVGARFREMPDDRRIEWRLRVDEYHKAAVDERIPDEQLEEIAGRIPRFLSQIFEVTHRDERPGEILVRVDFIGEESEGTLIGGAADEPYVDLFVDIRLPAGRPDADDVATRDAMLTELMQHCQSMRGIGEAPGVLSFVTRWADEATGRQRLIDVIGRLLPEIEFSIIAQPGPVERP